MTSKACHPVIDPRGGPTVDNAALLLTKDGAVLEDNLASAR